MVCSLDHRVLPAVREHHFDWITCNEGIYRLGWWLCSCRGRPATTERGCDGYDCPVPEVGPCSNWEGMLWGYFADIVCGRFDKWPLGFCLHPEIDRTSSTLERRLWSVLQNTLCSSNQNVWCSLMLSEGRWKCSIRKLHVTENRSLILSNQDNWKLVSLRFF